MYDYDKFLDLNFLNTIYINFLKNLSFWVFIGFMICLALLLISYHFDKDGCTRGNIYIITIILACATGLAFCILFIAFTLFPACYLCAVFKDLFIAKYTSLLLTPGKEFIINILSLTIGVGIYSFLIGKGLKEFLDS